MDTDLPPVCWRSEAFAEDLLDDGDRHDPPPATVMRGSLSQALLGAVPLLMAAAGALVATRGEAAA